MGKRKADLAVEKGTGRADHATGAAIVRVALSAVSLAWFGFSVPGCKGQPELTPQQVEGQHLYAVRCAHCHEENDLALKPPPPKIRGAMASAHLPSGAPATDAEVRRVVLAGKGKMPGFSGRFSEEQMAALLAYLHTEMP